MTTTTFSPGTTITSSWLNDVNTAVYTTLPSITGTGGVLKIAIIGDSMSAQNAILGPSITQVLEQRLNSMGVPCQIYGCNRDGHTYNRANTVAYIGGQTSVQACIAATPDVVIFLLGINDSLLAVDGRSLAQSRPMQM